MKRWLAALLSMVLAVSLAACGDDKGSSLDESSNSGAVISTGDPSSETSDEEESSLPESSEDEESSGEDTFSYAVGSWDGNTFHNETTGITFQCPESWTIYSNEELAQNLGIDASLFTEEGAKELASAAVFADFMAIDTATGNNISLMYENLDVTSPLVDVSLEEYADIVYAQAAGSSDATYTEGEKETRTLWGKDCILVPLYGSISGIDFAQYMILFEEGPLVGLVTVSCFDGTDVDTFLGYFE